MNQVNPDTNDDMQVTFDWAFQASIEMVFEALTLPEHIKSWFGPNHLETTFAESNPVVGGEYRIGVVVKGGDGTEMMYVGKYVEIESPELLVYTQAFSLGKDIPLTPETTITIRLKQEGDQTLMNFHQSGFAIKQAFNGARRSWPEVYEKFGKYLQTL